MNIFLWIVFGILVGWIASILTGNNARMGLVANLVVGLLGSVIGGWLGSLLGIGTIARFDLRSVLIGVGGAVVLLTALNVLRGGRKGA